MVRNFDSDLGSHVPGRGLWPSVSADCQKNNPQRQTVNVEEFIVSENHDRSINGTCENVLP
jgi:hypothetical protein